MWHVFVSVISIRLHKEDEAETQSIKGQDFLFAV